MAPAAAIDDQQVIVHDREVEVAGAGAHSTTALAGLVVLDCGRGSRARGDVGSRAISLLSRSASVVRLT